MDNSEAFPSPSRRSLAKLLALLPSAAASATPALNPGAAEAAPAAQPAYVPSFFNAAEWKFLVAACDRLIPQDEIGPGAVELGVPEFLDRHMQTPYAAGDIWYMQGPFVQAPREFGYQGRLVLRDILRVGIRGVERHCAQAYSNRSFAELEHAQQEEVLKGLEGGHVQIEEVPARDFFSYLLSEVRNGYFADPRHGGNRGMGAWKAIGYPGMRAEYLDWVEVRDRPYPLPAVDLSGRRA